MAGVYLHIPFCRQLCYYCDFYSAAGFGLKSAILEAIEQELVDRCDFLEGEPVETLYFGGGTPTVCTVAELGVLSDCVRRRYGVSEFTEFTVEANPDDLTAIYLRGLRELGVNRLSIGIQSFQDEQLRFMNRRHTAEDARGAVRRAQEAGFSNISVDLIYGIPGMTLKDLRYNLSEVLQLGVQHVSAYHLTIEPHTVFGVRERKGELTAIVDSESEAHYDSVDETLRQAGYDHYEISNFARPGYESRHNSAYWKGIPYLGVGPAAHSFRGAVRRWNVSSNRQYLESAGPTRYQEEHLSLRDIQNEVVMLSLRCKSGLDLIHFEERFGARKLRMLLDQALPYLSAGTLLHEGSVLRIPCGKMLVSDLVIEGLFSLE